VKIAKRNYYKNKIFIVEKIGEEKEKNLAKQKNH
jgi:hypothetical protein